MVFQQDLKDILVHIEPHPYGHMNFLKIFETKRKKKAPYDIPETAPNQSPEKAPILHPFVLFH